MQCAICAAVRCSCVHPLSSRELSPGNCYHWLAGELLEIQQNQAANLLVQTSRGLAVNLESANGQEPEASVRIEGCQLTSILAFPCIASGLAAS